MLCVRDALRFFRRSTFELKHRAVKFLQALHLNFATRADKQHAGYTPTLTCRDLLQ